MKTKHTPGPWIVGRSDKRGFVNVARHYWNGKLEACDFICELGPGAWEVESENHANARLIAAAPDLLEALQRAIPWLVRIIAGGGHLNSVDPDDAVGALQQAEAAIQKATQS